MPAMAPSATPKFIRGPVGFPRLADDETGNSASPPLIISGTVRDVSSVVQPNVAVYLFDSVTNLLLQVVTTDINGFYRFAMPDTRLCYAVAYLTNRSETLDFGASFGSSPPDGFGTTVNTLQAV